MHNYYSEPFGDSSQIPSFLLSKYAKQKIKIVLTDDQISIKGLAKENGKHHLLYFT